MDHSVGTLTKTSVAFIPHQDIRRLMQTRPHLLAAFWREALVEASIFREWMVGIGRRSSLMRVAHLLCELFIRYRAVNLADGYSFPYHFRQTDIGDSLGLSIVHVNRVIGQLKSDGIIEISGRKMTILDWKKLKNIGEFDMEYLHIQNAENSLLDNL